MFPFTRPLRVPVRQAAAPDPLQPLADALVQAASVDAVIEALRSELRTLAGADGITVIRRIGEEVLYVTEDAIAPLWAGKRFPLRLCVSGMAMIARAPVLIPDIAHDRRVPMNLYLSTFVRSMAIYPIGHGEPRMAMGAYWQEEKTLAPEVSDRLARAAHLAGDAMDRIICETTPQVA